MRITAEEAFRPLPNEKKIPLISAGGHHNFEFTRRWFLSRNLSTWSNFIFPHFVRGEATDTPPLNVIQIGVFEGMDLLWLLQHVLTHPDSRALAVDPWLATTKLDQEYMDGVMLRARKNLSPWAKKAHLWRGKSDEVLSVFTSMPSNISNENCPNVCGTVIRPGEWDLAIIDGDHNADAVFVDAQLCLRLLKPGGWLVFDDVRNRTPKKDHVQQGLDQFLAGHEHLVTFEWAHRYCDCYSKL